MADATQKEEPWWASFPEAKAACERIEASTVKGMILADKDSGKGAARDFLLVDVRRTDYEGGTIATSINLPAQSFYQTRPVTHQLCKQAGIKKIIFYCGSSSGRGPRSANWMQDYLNEVGEQDIQALILTGGIKGWVKTYDGDLMDFYDEKVWKQPPS